MIRLSRQSLALAAIPLLGLVAGVAVFYVGRPDIAGWIWIAGIVPVLAYLLVSIVRSLAKGDIGLDVIAALAMGGAIVGGEPFAGIVVAMMYAGGQALEDYAQGRAQAEMTALLGRVARAAMVYRNGTLASEPIEALLPGDRILVRAGDVVPADGTIRSGEALLDESALTGEPMPVRRRMGDDVLSGVTNAGAPFDLDVAKSAGDSTYAQIARLVEQARNSKAPMARLADRYALGFLAVTVLLAAGAWLISGEPIRALAVLVVATPCPLILAVPVAIVAGMSRCAKRGIMIKTARTLELLPRVKTLLIDKTGTVTEGHPGIEAIEPEPGVDAATMVRLAASLAQASQHVISEALVDAAHGRDITLVPPTSVEEQAGDGVSGAVEGHQMRIGRRAFAEGRTGADGGTPLPPGVTSLSVAIDGAYAGRILFADRLREEAPATLRALRENGIDRIVLLTGDRADVAAAIGKRLGVEAVIADATPQDKVAAAMAEKKAGPTMMVGDGINDAPVLAYADVGVALGARGAVAASEAADMIVMVDRLDRIAEALSIASRSRRIALQSVAAGIGLSVLGMIAAAFGYLPPVAGALLQEVIDLAVILNALRALGAGR
ncbi:cadmium-translocating P-type ATPase [Kaistia algarum]|uniref:heavy metal translocating P-type ATPase n=1 Tax=Kaistia algarum TaxID=2083279 RepID=UPI000CE8FDAE|nr:heavy metal translocating P-type ATPase [Kaistia algarum]MCX5515030.1 heavy metal translocating P-type ATPase [Kaistia algarum]PPE79771.1 cadmium-translocating P-type ATPase [Kaistia algarum]